MPAIGPTIEVESSSSRVQAVYGAARSFLTKGLPALAERLAEMARSVGRGSVYTATHDPRESYRELIKWVKEDPTRAFGYTGLLGDVAMLAAGGAAANPFIAYCGFSGLALQALNSAFGEKVAPLTNAMLVVQGVSMGLSGAGLASHGVRSMAELVNAVCIGGSGIAMGLDGWRDGWHRLFSAKPQDSASPDGEAPVIEVADSQSRAVAVAADVPALAGRLNRLERLAGNVFTRRNLAAALFTMASAGLMRDAVATRNPMMMAAAVFFSLSTVAARMEKAPSADTPAATEDERSDDDEPSYGARP